MAKHPKIHPYSDRESFERLMLLIAAIAQNPGIADQRTTQAKNVDPMELLQEAMVKLAAELEIEYEPYSLHTLRHDLKTLRKFGLMPSGIPLRRGYYLGLLKSFQ